MNKSLKPCKCNHHKVDHTLRSNEGVKFSGECEWPDCNCKKYELLARA